MVRLDGNKPGKALYVIPDSDSPRNLAVALSVELLRAELKGIGLARS
ncbi:MAG: hypothetical protein R3281_02595 [Balneolaceae bacterium]|nr:hypothetical protein [Balneolaceae bacterium]